MELSFGGGFNQPIGRIVWPPYLQKLSFAVDFNHPIAGVVWLASLQTLSFGECLRFNQPIAGVAWPVLLLELSLGVNFDQPIAGVTWPVSLQQLDIVWGKVRPAHRWSRVAGLSPRAVLGWLQPACQWNCLATVPAETVVRDMVQPVPARR